MEILDENVVERDKTGFIAGATGSGKSVSTLSFAASLDCQIWSAIWVHWSALEVSYLDLGAMQHGTIVDIVTFSLPRTRNNRLFVWLDGFNHTNEDCNTLTRILYSQLKHDDRFGICTSTSSLGKRKTEDDARAKIIFFFLYSWTQYEYLAVVTNQKNYDKVTSKFTGSSSYDVNDSDSSDEELSEDEKKKHVVQLKFHYAGGLCRFMFQYTTEEVKRVLEKGAEFVDNTDLVKYCDGTSHIGVIDHLYGMQSGRSKRFPVSSYTTFLFAADCGEEVIQELTRRIN
ncbi:hypothetical protein JG688_00008955 [Phytophthora aleatoria]|uniref:Crinkler (CRN) family protein n=1 Tax=Phytophthora aleatoria TaxID=2496075 RepID=A0A8J5IUC6_9STRA|nr:hypothetical protein JG688_00008955 [Phytophthora aleatoria]